MGYRFEVLARSENLLVRGGFIFLKTATGCSVLAWWKFWKIYEQEGSKKVDGACRSHGQKPSVSHV